MIDSLFEFLCFYIILQEVYESDSNLGLVNQVVKTQARSSIKRNYIDAKQPALSTAINCLISYTSLVWYIQDTDIQIAL